MTEALRHTYLRTSPSGAHFALAVDAPHARIFDTATGALVATLATGGGTGGKSWTTPRDRAHVRDVALSDADPHLRCPSFAAVGATDGTVTVVSLADVDAPWTVGVDHQQRSVVAMALAPPWMVVLGVGYLRLVHLKKRNCVGAAMQPPRSMTSIAARVVPDGFGGQGLRLVLHGGKCVWTQLSAAECENPTSFPEKTTQWAGVSLHSQRTFVWMGDTAFVGASLSDGVVHVWDVPWATNDATGRNATPQCRRSLTVGAPLLHVSAVDGDGTHGAMIAATTAMGDVKVWAFAELAPANVVGDGAAPPTWQFTSAVVTGRLRAAVPMHRDTDAAALVVRGALSTPMVEFVPLKLTQRSGATMRLPLPRGFAPVRLNDAERSHAEEARWEDTLAADAAATAVWTPPPPTAPSFPEVQGIASTPMPNVSTAVKGMMMPMLQALHANDDGAVMSLLTLASRTGAALAALVRDVPTPAVRKLTIVLARRAATSPLHAPIHAWIATILSVRARDILPPFKKNAEEDTTGGGDVAEEAMRRVLTPLGKRYREWLTLRAPLAQMYGRLRSVISSNDGGTTGRGRPRSFVVRWNAAAGTYESHETGLPSTRRKKRGRADVILDADDDEDDESHAMDASSDGGDSEEGADDDGRMEVEGDIGEDEEEEEEERSEKSTSEEIDGEGEGGDSDGIDDRESNNEYGDNEGYVAGVPTLDDD